MKHYYLDTNLEGDGTHIIHTEECDHLPARNNRKYLGFFTNTYQPLQVAWLHCRRPVICSRCFPGLAVADRNTESLHT